MADLIDRKDALEICERFPYPEGIANAIAALPAQGVNVKLAAECRQAVNGEGPRAYDWSDKPHRLVYDLCREIERLAAIREFK
jgi:hypothetical protein